MAELEGDFRTLIASREKFPDVLVTIGNSFAQAAADDSWLRQASKLLMSSCHFSARCLQD